MRPVLWILALLPIGLQIGWLGYLVWALWWRITCTDRYESCYWSGVVIQTWLVVGLGILPFTIIGAAILFRLRRPPAVEG